MEIKLNLTGEELEAIIKRTKEERVKTEEKSAAEDGTTQKAEQDLVWMLNKLEEEGTTEVLGETASALYLMGPSPSSPEKLSIIEKCNARAEVIDALHYRIVKKGKENEDNRELIEEICGIKKEENDLYKELFKLVFGAKEKEADSEQESLEKMLEKTGLEEDGEIFGEKLYKETKATRDREDWLKLDDALTKENKKLVMVSEGRFILFSK